MSSVWDHNMCFPCYILMFVVEFPTQPKINLFFGDKAVNGVFELTNLMIILSVFECVYPTI